MIKKENNYAFIDSQNLNLGVRELGWNLDWKRFRVYLKEKYAVKQAYIFIGFVGLNQSLYNRLQESGFIIMLKPTIPDAEGKIKGNVDADLVLQVILEVKNYDKAVIVSSDGDFYSLVQHLYGVGKLKAVISPNLKTCSSLLRQAARDRLQSMEELKEKLEYIKRKAPLKDETSSSASHK